MMMTHADQGPKQAPPPPGSGNSGSAGPAQPGVGRPNLILVVEDNEINQTIVRRMVERLGFEVIIAENGKRGYEMARERRTDLCAVLMDCQMPVMDGFDATKNIRAFETEEGHARVPIIAVTANALDADRRRCQEVGMDDFVTKPVKRGILIEALERHGLLKTAAA